MRIVSQPGLGPTSKTEITHARLSPISYDSQFEGGEDSKAEAGSALCDAQSR